MRILKTRQYELVEAKDIPDPFPPYAILSHMWLSPKEEITYQDFKSRKEDIENDVYKQTGWAKLKRYCDRAARDGWDWAWMDTCCIDKTNPADTQEAINAMFRWYQNASICYAYLGDVDAYGSLEEAGLIDQDHPMNEDLDEMPGMIPVPGAATNHMRTAVGRSLVNAKWFTRGWTLQELLAPRYLVFMDKSWHRIGTRESWAAEINEASRIEPKHLTTFKPTDFTSCSIAMRMSWASSRYTTVEEDETYSLLGLFGISLPLIYGEGRWRAFDRLQRELIMVYTDDSIFAWKLSETNQGFIRLQRQGQKPGLGILAPSIREFRDASQIQSFGYYGHKFEMSNLGLKTNARRWKCHNDHTKLLIRLNCGPEPKAHTGIMLRYAGEVFERIMDSELHDTRNFERSRDWIGVQEKEGKDIIIRAGNFRGPLTGPSIFTLRHPDEITVGLKYFMDFNVPLMSRKLELLDEVSLLGRLQLQRNELLLQPNQLMFANIELQTGEHQSRWNVLININENGFPSVGMASQEDRGKQLGDPMSEAKRKYENLAEDFHDQAQSEGCLPLIVETKQGISVNVHLFPRPPRERSSETTRDGEVYIEMREYTLKIIGKEKKDLNGSKQPQSSS
ncbi:unnamed protein product [Clonostachys byssicola]|uniref:Heterokaryon incompatibility domain-containing protein n=1 Tax=Clonostachys byssicola TaxID=160290 RepID=A0A9N9UFK6_9HYPO|nr:unnamed protein product [Clonostachys byssicola]